MAVSSWASGGLGATRRGKSSGSPDRCRIPRRIGRSRALTSTGILVLFTKAQFGTAAGGSYGTLAPAPSSGRGRSHVRSRAVPCSSRGGGAADGNDQDGCSVVVRDGGRGSNWLQ